MDKGQLATYPDMKLMATHSARSISYYLCLFMQAQFQLGSYIHTCTNETYSLANSQDLIRSYFGSNNFRQHKLTKVEIKSCRFAIECVLFVNVWM